MDENKVNVNYIKSENNVADILTKNLQPRLFEKHASKLVTNVVDESKQMNDVGFFVRCNPRRIGKAGTWRDTCWAREDLFAKLAAPMGEIRRQVYREDNYDITAWYPNGERLKRLRRKVEGPLQRGYWNRKYDRTGKFVYPSERHVIKKYRNSYGDVVNIYDTDRTTILDRVWNQYNWYSDTTLMLAIVRDKKVPKEKREDEYLKRTYESTTYWRTCCRRPDPIHD